MLSLQERGKHRQWVVNNLAALQFDRDKNSVQICGDEGLMKLVPRHPKIEMRANGDGTPWKLDTAAVFLSDDGNEFFPFDYRSSKSRGQ
jgi:hypothetical protein